MFKFLKDKIKGAISKFSKSIEDESPKEELKKQFEEEKIETAEIKKKPEEKVKIEKKKDSKHEKKKPEAKKEHPEKNSKKISISEAIEKQDESEEEGNISKEPIEKKELTKDKKELSEIKESEFKEAELIKPEEEIEVKEEKKGFFSKLKDKFIKKEEKIETADEKKEIIKEETKSEEKPEEKKGFFGTIKEKITTTKISEDKFEELFYELELALLENNVAFEVVDKIKTDLKKDLVDKPIKRGEVEEEIKNGLKESIEDLFLVPKINLMRKINEKNEKPFVICFVGQNGSGKTTSIAKLTHLLRQEGLSVVLSASDTFRAAAIQQLKEWGNRLNVKVVAHDYGSDPAAVAFDAISYAKAHNSDVVLIDTAGRQHSNKDLMREMEKIVRIAKPDLKIFVGEAITGNDCTEQAKEFNETVGIDGIILAKADVDEKGGAIISTSYVTHRPIVYLGTGQNVEDLKEFNEKEVMSNLGF
ncbi:signal recognition particle-docking protein FtsY [Candidatus Woesearchaeota archaeon]|nr:signal recognition particle-docking protein FtsY [Candidatus Woesearchaeota archaeon]